jgi:hypothetical protein
MPNYPSLLDAFKCEISISLFDMIMHGSLCVFVPDYNNVKIFEV